MKKFSFLLLIAFVSCNSANPPKGEERLPDDQSAGMTNNHNNRTVYPTPDSTANQSIIATDTSMHDTRNHFVDTNQNAGMPAH